jgi:alanine racemase
MVYYFRQAGENMTSPLQHKHRLWAEIDLDRMENNFKIAQSAAVSGKVMPVIKADAYGHGAVQTALALRSAGADFFAVATPEEAMQLRRHGIDCNILLLGAAPASHLSALADAGITLCVPDAGTARLYRDSVGGRKVDVHIKINTGMTRLGFSPHDIMLHLPEITEHFNVTGLFTHFASADDPQENAFTKIQFESFISICAEIRSKGLGGAVLHTANSAALLFHPYSHLDYVRPGLMLYGYSPANDANNNLKPVLSLHTSVMQIHTVPSGTTVSYGRTWKAQRQSVVATVPVGYADGLSWSLSGGNAPHQVSDCPLTGRAYMLVQGCKAPIIGRVCMDFCALDVTDIPGAAQGGLVTVLGDGIDAAEHARLSCTIPWEVLCSIGRRVPRIYKRNGQIIEESVDLDRL